MTVYVVCWENGIWHEDCLSIWRTERDAQAEAARLNAGHCQPWHKGCQVRGTKCVGRDYRVKSFKIANPSTASADPASVKP